MRASISFKATAHVFSAVVGPFVASGQKQQALNALRAISKLPNVPYAVIIGPDGRQFTALGSAIVVRSGNGPATSSSTAPQSLWALLKGASLPVVVPVVHAGRPMGRLMLLADVADLRQRLLESLLAIVAAASIASVIGLTVTRRLRRGITNPLQDLALAMMQVRQTHDFSTRVIKTSDDETGLLVDSFNDMLEQVSLRDAQLAAHRENLERTVEARTHELREAKETAEAANSAKSDFLATMSHEIRTPMNGVMVMAEMLAGSGLPKRQQRFAEIIARSGQSLLTIINDILDLSKIEAGKLELESLPTDPASIVDDVMNLFWERATNKKLDLAAYVSPDIPQKISADPVRLNQILANLVNNALKFTEKGYVGITVRMLPEVANNGVPILEFAVVDTGIGIEADKIEHVFQSFSQADQTTTRRFGGTGLGLSICKRLVEAMSGNITVESRIGKGSRFSFRIPAKMVEPPNKIADLSREKPISVAILVNGTATPHTMASYLSLFGITADIADPAQASDFPPEKYDVLIADTASALAADAKGGKVQIIVVSELGEITSEELLKSGKAHDLIMRPISQRDMLETIDRLVNGRLRGIDAISEAASSSIELPDFGGAKVLVTDDNAINREVIIEALRRLNVRIDTAEHGEEAVSKWQQGDYRLVFMDCSMPVMDGYTATRLIRQHETATGAERTPVIALTAHVAGGPADQWRTAGMDGIITKPFTLDAIADCLATWLSGTGEQGEADGRPSETNPNETPRLEANEPAIDKQVIENVRKMSGGNNELLLKTTRLFKDHAPAAFANLEDTAKSEDLTALADAAHALKSMCANMGAAQVASACDEVERLARTQVQFDAAPHLVTISQELTSAIAELQSICSAHVA